MDGFGYAHGDGAPYRSATADFNAITFSEGLEEVKADARRREIPVSDDETLRFLISQIELSGARRVLEIGTAVGVSACAVLESCPRASVVTVEKDPAFAEEATENFRRLGHERRVNLICGDAADVLPRFTDVFDFVFLDGAKVQYVKYVPELKRVLRPGGAVFADDVLLYGYVTGEAETPRKRRSIVGHIREYIDAMTSDGDFLTTVVNIGNGVALSIRKRA